MISCEKRAVCNLKESANVKYLFQKTVLNQLLKTHICFNLPFALSNALLLNDYCFRMQTFCQPQEFLHKHVHRFLKLCIQ